MRVPAAVGRSRYRTVRSSRHPIVRRSLAAVAASAILVAASPRQLASQADEVDPLAEAPALGWSAGETEAPVTVVEFSDLSCPYCAGFHEGTRAALRKEFVASGRVRWITLSYVSGLYRNSERLSVAAECAGRQGLYETFVGAAYDERDRWISARDPELATVVSGLAATTGVDEAAFSACQGDPAVTERLERIGALARDAGVRGTPTWLVNGFPVMGNLPLGYARQFIESQLEEPGR